MAVQTSQISLSPEVICCLLMYTRNRLQGVTFQKNIFNIHLKIHICDVSFLMRGGMAEHIRKITLIKFSPLTHIDIHKHKHTNTHTHTEHTSDVPLTVYSNSMGLKFCYPLCIETSLLY